jgi:hypothetical protein
VQPYIGLQMGIESLRRKAIDETKRPHSELLPDIDL